MATRIQLRRDTAANWTAADPVLAAGEEGYETDTGKRKIGDGASRWSALSYMAGGVTDHGALSGLSDDDHPQYQARSEKGAASGYAPLDSGSKIPSAHIPPVALTERFVVNSQAAQLALTAQQGDVAIRTDQSRTYIRNAGTAGTMADWTELATPPDAIQSVNGKTGTVSLSSADVGAAPANAPYVNARVTSDTNVVSNTYTQVPFGFINLDSWGLVDTQAAGGPIVNLGVLPGKWLFHIALSLNKNQAGVGYALRSRLERNGVLDDNITWDGSIATSADSMIGTIPIEVRSGDYFRVCAWQNTGANMTVLSNQVCLLKAIYQGD